MNKNKKYRLTQQGDEIVSPKYATLGDLDELRKDVRDALDEAIEIRSEQQKEALKLS